MDNGSGKAGEDLAARYLMQKGYDIVERNYHTRFGEIDIIARDARYLAFVEVKTRARGGLTDPLESITPAKRGKIIRSALLYLQSHMTGLQPRFDVIGVIIGAGEKPAIKHLENAFFGKGFL